MPASLERWGVTFFSEVFLSNEVDPPEGADSGKNGGTYLQKGKKHRQCFACHDTELARKHNDRNCLYTARQTCELLRLEALTSSVMRRSRTEETSSKYEKTKGSLANVPPFHCTVEARRRVQGPSWESYLDPGFCKELPASAISHHRVMYAG